LEAVLIDSLVPTQPSVRRTQIDSIVDVSVPIVCIRYENKYYILDGHARSMRAVQLMRDTIEAMVLLPHQPVIISATDERFLFA
jgi:hypothetical protein